jgi:hypothetical protein
MGGGSAGMPPEGGVPQPFRPMPPEGGVLRPFRPMMVECPGITACGLPSGRQARIGA